MTVKRGDTFAHRRWIIGSPKAGTARPEIVTVTSVRAGQVYYRGEDGTRASHVADIDRFLASFVFTCRVCADGSAPSVRRGEPVCDRCRDAAGIGQRPTVGGLR